jgi:RNA-directed DNA polymerase
MVEENRRLRQEHLGLRRANEILKAARAVGGQDLDHPHRRGCGLPRLAHPAPPQEGTNQHYIYTYPAKKSLKAVIAKVKTLRRQVEVNQPLDDMIRRLNQAVRGWCAYFRPGVSSVTLAYLSHYLWQRVWRWLRRKHRRATWKELRRRYCDGGWWPRGQQRQLFDPEKPGTTRYLYRGSNIPALWPVI